MAAASLGQAHRATLLPADAADTGLHAVVVKVQRPGIDEIVDVDLAALRKVGGWLSRVRLVSDRVDMPALVEEFAQTSLEEIDYLHEAASAERFAADFAGDERVAVPAVVWERTTRRVLTLEDVTAIKITDAEALRAAGHRPGRGGPGLRGRHVRPAVHATASSTPIRIPATSSSPRSPTDAGARPVEADVHRLRHDGRGPAQARAAACGSCSSPPPRATARAWWTAMRDVGVLLPLGRDAPSSSGR